jgi:hypothetical protein
MALGLSLSEYHCIFLSLAYLLYGLVMELHIWYSCSLYERVMFLNLDPWSYHYGQVCCGGILVLFRGKHLVVVKPFLLCLF